MKMAPRLLTPIVPLSPALGRRQRGLGLRARGPARLRVASFDAELVDAVQRLFERAVVVVAHGGRHPCIIDI